MIGAARAAIQATVVQDAPTDISSSEKSTVSADHLPSRPPSLYSRALFRFIDWLRGRIARASLVGDQPIFDNARFPWVAGLEARADAIRGELDELLRERERLPAFH